MVYLVEVCWYTVDLSQTARVHSWFIPIFPHLSDLHSILANYPRLGKVIKCFGTKDRNMCSNASTENTRNKQKNISMEN